jgi:integrase
MEARVWKDGKTVTYRYHPIAAKPIPLGTDKREAIQKVLDMNGRASDQGTFLQLWRLYQKSPEFKAKAESTQRFYRECWGRAPGEKGPDDEGAGLARVWAYGNVAAARAADVARYLRKERADAPTVANREVSLLSNLFNLAVEMGDIDRNPCREVRRNKETPRTRLVEEQEFSPFVAWALQQGKSAVVLVSLAEFAALSGNRRVEFRIIHWPQVDDEVVRLNRAKQRSGREKREILARSAALDVVLARMRAQEGYNPMGAVFAAPRTGKPYSEPGFKGMWNRLMLKAVAAGVVKERFTFHDLRAYYTSVHKKRFGELPELHEDPATTARVYERTRTVTRRAL